MAAKAKKTKVRKSATAKKRAPKSDKAMKLRLLVLNNPSASPNELVELAKQAKIPKVVRQNIYLAQSQLRSRYGYKEVPVHHNKLNRSELIRLALNKKPNMTNDQVISYLATDGVEVNQFLIQNVRKTSKKAAAESENHPDPNFGKGPRAGKVRGKRRRTKHQVQIDRLSEIAETENQYKAMESQLDRLIQQAQELGNRRLAEATKQARRIASSELV